MSQNSCQRSWSPVTLALASSSLAGLCFASICLADERPRVPAGVGSVTIRLQLSSSTQAAIAGKTEPNEAEGLLPHLQPPPGQALPRKPGMPERSMVFQCLYGADSNNADNNHGQQGSDDNGETSTERQPNKLPPDPVSLLLEPSHGKQPPELDREVNNQESTQPESSAPLSTHNNELRMPGGSLGSGAPSQPMAVAKGEDKPGGECPGSPDSGHLAPEAQPDDVRLEQDEHPYDAPAAEATNGEPQSRIISDYSREEVAIRQGINACLAYLLAHPENVSKRGPWALMHAALPLGVETEVIAGNRRVNALGWMCYNGVCAQQRIFQPTQRGFRTNVGAGVQGHEGQFLAILAQSSVQSDYPIQVGNRGYTIMDLVYYEMATCREKSELTFKLIGLSHYLEPEQRWRDSRGHAWNLEKMVAEELSQPVVGAACGGSHRLMGLSYALIHRQQSGLPIDGNWKRAEIFLNDFVNYAMSLQNSDGSFSTEWFEGRGEEPLAERKVQTTGHILEWLIYTLPDEYLRSPRIQKSVKFLIRTIGDDPNRDWPIGPRGHALRALALYNQRVFGAKPGGARASLARMTSGQSKR